MKSKPYSAHKIGNLCGVVNQTVINWLNNGYMPYHKTPGGQFRVYPEDLVEFLLARGIRVPKELETYVQNRSDESKYSEKPDTKSDTLSDRTYSATEAATFFEVVPQTLINWIKQGHISVVTTPGGQYRIYSTEIVRFMKTRGMTVPTKLDQEHTSGNQDKPHQSVVAGTEYGRYRDEAPVEDGTEDSMRDIDVAEPTTFNPPKQQVQQVGDTRNIEEPFLINREARVESTYGVFSNSDSESIQHRKFTNDMPVETPPEIVADDSFISIPKRVYLGNSVTNKSFSVFWEHGHSEMPNRHLLLFGASGVGKTYAIQRILAEFSQSKRNSLVIDYTNGFLPNHLEEDAIPLMNPRQHIIRQTPLPINPFIAQEIETGGILLVENANAVAKRIAGIFRSVYRIGDQQYSLLHRSIMDGIKDFGREMSLSKLLIVLDRLSEEGRFRTVATSLESKLRPFIMDRPFSSGKDSFDWSSLFSSPTEGAVNIIQLAGLDAFSATVVTEFILWDLLGFFRAQGSKRDPRVIVLDEVQNLSHEEGGPLSRFLREGRKFGVSLILATQTLSGMKKDETDRMFNASHKLFFRPADTELRSFAEIAARSTGSSVSDWIRSISRLGRGECYSIGPTVDSSSGNMVNSAIHIKIAPFTKK